MAKIKSTPTDNDLFQKPDKGEVDWDVPTNANWDVADNELHFRQAENMIINGNFDIWQRGTSFSAIGFTADRWYLSFAGTGVTCTLSRGTKTVGQELPPTRAAYFAQAVFDDSSTDGNVLLQYRVPNLWAINNKTITVSFWAQADVNLELGVEITHHDGTAEHHDVITPVKLAITGGSWNFYTATFVCPLLPSYSTNADTHFRMNLWLSGGDSSWSGGVPHQSGNLQFSGFGIGYGDRYIPVRERTIEEEMTLCKNFYQSVSGLGLVGAYAGSYVQMNEITLPVLMRKTPSITDDNITFFGYSGTPGPLHSAYIEPGTLAPVYQWTSAVPGEMFRCDGGRFILDAELP